jgi:hypothetical protein
VRTSAFAKLPSTIALGRSCDCAPRRISIELDPPRTLAPTSRWTHFDESVWLDTRPKNHIFNQPRFPDAVAMRAKAVRPPRRRMRWAPAAAAALCVTVLVPSLGSAFVLPQGHVLSGNARFLAQQCSPAGPGAMGTRAHAYTPRFRPKTAAFHLWQSCAAPPVPAAQGGGDVTEAVAAGGDNPVPGELRRQGDPAATLQPLLDADLLELSARKAVGMEGDIVSKIRCEVFNQDRGLFRAQRRKMRQCPYYLLAGIYHTTFLVAVARPKTPEGQVAR